MAGSSPPPTEGREVQTRIVPILAPRATGDDSACVEQPAQAASSRQASSLAAPEASSRGLVVLVGSGRARLDDLLVGCFDFVGEPFPLDGAHLVRRRQGEAASHANARELLFDRRNPRIAKSRKPRTRKYYQSARSRGGRRHGRGLRRGELRMAHVSNGSPRYRIDAPRALAGAISEDTGAQRPSRARLRPLLV